MTGEKDTSKQTKLPSNIRFTKLGKIVMIAISLIWVALGLFLLFGLRDNNSKEGIEWEIIIVRIVVFAIPFAFLNNFVKDIMSQAMKQLKLISDDDSSGSEEGANSKAFIYVMATIFLVGGVVRGAVDVINDSDPTTTTEVITSTTSQTKESTILPTESQITKFDFSGNPKQYDIYFEDVVDRKELFDVLEESLRKIYEEDKVLDTELNETLYGEIEEETDSLQTILEGYLEDPEMKGKRILKTINGIIIANMLEMDREYKIPENRQEIADAYLVSADNELGNRRLIDYENAVKYLWGSLYVSISWNEYNPEIIDRLIEAYDNLAEHNFGQAVRVANIQAALKVIKARFEQEPVEPLECK